MINFLRISNNIKLGYYLHSNGNIDNVPSPDVIGICVIPSNFLPDRLARFISLRRTVSTWGGISKLNTKYKKILPSKNLRELNRGSLDGRTFPLVSPYLPDGSFNSDFLIDLPQGNAFQDYKGYENTKIYRENYKGLGYPDNIFSSCFRISPSYRKSDWYLPSVGELALLFEKKSLINSVSRNSINGVILSGSSCWSSSEWDIKYAWNVSMYSGFVSFSGKEETGYVYAFLTL